MGVPRCSRQMKKAASLQFDQLLSQGGEKLSNLFALFLLASSADQGWVLPVAAVIVAFALEAGELLRGRGGQQLYLDVGAGSVHGKISISDVTFLGM